MMSTRWFGRSGSCDVCESEVSDTDASKSRFTIYVLKNPYDERFICFQCQKGTGHKRRMRTELLESTPLSPDVIGIVTSFFVG